MATDTATADSPPDLDPAINAALKEYLTLLDSATETERQAWCERYAALMPQLQCYLDGFQYLQEFAPTLRSAAVEIRMGSDVDVLSRPLGDFHLLRRIGQGGMGIVYEAEQNSLRRRVAVKILAFAGAFDDTLTQRFLREAQAAASLSHSHIVPVLTVGCEHGVHFYAMQLIAGGSMAELIYELRSRIPKNQKPAELPAQVKQAEWFQRIAAFGVQAARALHYAHEQGIVHRDVKPANLLVDETNHLFVTDFGLAATREATELTITGHMTGTLRYASPEQVLGKRAGVDHRTDIYSLGASLYELATLSHLVPGDDQRSLTHDILHSSRESPRQINDAVPKDLETVILKAVANDRADRYETAEEFAEELQRFLDGHPVKARRQSRAVLMVRSFLRRPRLALGIILTMVIMIGMLTASTIIVSRARQSSERLQDVTENQAKRLESLQRVTQQQLTEEIEHGRLLQATRYTKSISLAQQMFNEHNFGVAQKLLTDLVPRKGEPDLRGFEWHYLSSQCHSGGQELQGHEGEVYCLAWSPDGTRIASASQDKTIRIWSLFPDRLGEQSPGRQAAPDIADSAFSGNAQGHDVMVLSGHTSEVNFVAFSPDGSHIASASDDGTIRIWPVNGDVSGHGDVSGQKAVPGLQSSHPFREFKGHDNPVVGVAFSPKSGHLVSSDDRGQLFVWDLETGEILSRTQAHDKRIEGFEFTRDGSRIVSAGSDSTVVIWSATDLPNLTDLNRLTGTEGAIYSVAWSHDGNRIVGGGWDAKLRMWSQEHDHSFPALMKCSAEVRSVCFSPDGRFATCTTLAGNIHQIDSRTGQTVDTLHIPNGRCWTAQYSPDGRWLAAAGSGKSLFLWPADPEERHRGERIRTENEISQIFITDDGQQLVTFESPSTVRLRNVKSGEVCFQFPGEYHDEMSIALGMHGELFLVNAAREIECWDLTLTLPTRKACRLSGTRSLQITSAGNRRYVSQFEEVPTDLVTGKPMLPLSAQTKISGQAFVGPDVECIPIFHFYDGYWWYPNQQKQVPCKFLQRPYLAAFSRDGRTLYTADEFVIHQVSAGQSETEGLPWPCEGRVQDLAVSPDGKTLVSASGSLLKFWNLVAHEAAMTIDHPGETVIAVAFTPDGSTLIYSSISDAPAGAKSTGILRFVRL